MSGHSNANVGGLTCADTENQSGVQDVKCERRREREVDLPEEEGKRQRADSNHLEKTLSWLQCRPTGTLPSARQAVTTAQAPDVFWVFGGGPCEGPYDNQLFALTLNSGVGFRWEEIPQKNAPSPRGVAVMALCRGALYLFGGYNGKDHLGDLHVFDLMQKTWREVPLKEPKPCPRRGGSMVEYGGKLYLLGGSATMDGIDDLWCFDPETESWKWLVKTGLGIFRHSAVVFGDCMVVFAGVRTHSGSPLLFFYDFPGNRGAGVGGRWRDVRAAGEQPRATNAHEAARLGDHMVVWGGISCETGEDNKNCCILHIPSLTWCRVANNPAPLPPRVFFALGVLQDTIVVALGRQDEFNRSSGKLLKMTYFDDLWSLNINT